MAAYDDQKAKTVVAREIGDRTKAARTRDYDSPTSQFTSDQISAAISSERGVIEHLNDTG